MKIECPECHFSADVDPAKVPQGGDKLKTLKDGRIVLGVDSRNVGSFRRFDAGGTAADEALLRYRIRGGAAQIRCQRLFLPGETGETVSAGKIRRVPGGSRWRGAPGGAAWCRFAGAWAEGRQRPVGERRLGPRQSNSAVVTAGDARLTKEKLRACEQWKFAREFPGEICRRASAHRRQQQSA
jgi:hypothetical protein